MRVFVFYTDDDSPEPDSGFVRAETAEEALALIGHPEANVYELPAEAEWPRKVALTQVLLLGVAED